MAVAMTPPPYLPNVEFVPNAPERRNSPPRERMQTYRVRRRLDFDHVVQLAQVDPRYVDNELNAIVNELLGLNVPLQRQVYQGDRTTRCPTMHAAIDRDATCSICLDPCHDLETCGRLDCGHSFHKRCITEWFGMKKNSCPNCRRCVV
jgi:hypothetical protein